MSLWALDVLVHLGLVERLFGADQLVSGVGFLGLLLVHVQLAAATALAALLGASVLVRWTRRDPDAEAVALLAGMLAGASVLVGSGIVWGGVAGLGTWLGVRALALRRSTAAWDFAGSTRYVMWPLLWVGFVQWGVIYAMDEQVTEAQVMGLLAALVLPAGLWIRRVSASRWTRQLGWLPLWSALALAALLSFGAWTPGAPASAPPPVPSSASGRPHIVLIVLDTLRADHLRSYGYAKDTMPSLERWGAGALRVDRAISAAGWTSPSHASIFSGRNVSAHGVHFRYHRTPGGRFWTYPVEGIEWLPQRLAEQGYACFAVTANELALPEQITGFREVIAPRFLDWGRSVAGFFDRHLLWTLPLSERLRWRMPYVAGGEMVEIAKRAVPEDADPVFLFVNLMDAHAPYNPPPHVLAELSFQHPRIFSRYATAYEITRAWEQLPEGKHAYLNDLYDAGLRWLDTNLATLLQWVDTRFGENTIVVITSDHGELLGEGGRVGHDHGLAPELVHVPLWLRAPGVTPGGLELQAGVRNVYALLAAAGSGQPADPRLLLDGPEGSISERYPRDMDGSPGRTWVSLIEGDLQVVGPSADGLEVRQLGQTDGEPDPEAVARLSERIDRYWEEQRDRRQPDLEAGGLTQERLQRLRALGYVN